MAARKKIVILGGGFAGIEAALQLEKNLDLLRYEIILINKRPVHVYRPDLYEIATAFSEKITEECLVRLKETVAIPLDLVFRKKRVALHIDQIEKIDPATQKVFLKKSAPLHGDYLIVALGSVSNDFGIKGLAEHSLRLKTLRDALAISCDIDQLFHSRWKRHPKEPITIVVGGGGATGVELTCELVGFTRQLSKKYHYPPEKVSIRVIEAGGVVGGQGPEVSRAILRRFSQLKIETRLQAKITHVEKNRVVCTGQGGESAITYDAFIWTGGVRAHPLIAESFKKTAPSGALSVNEFLQSAENPRIFAAGDCAYIMDPSTKRPAPLLAQLALQQGHHCAEMIIAKENHRAVWPYVPRMKGTVTPLGGAYALFHYKSILVAGFFPWLLRRLIDLAYAMRVTPPWYAFKKWLRDSIIFTSN